MLFDERNEGDYRIYAGALEAPQGDGYLAAVVISRLRGVTNAPREAYRDTALAAGYRWASARDALTYAVAKGVEMIRSERQRLAC
jgi:hypothetical protein